MTDIPIEGENPAVVTKNGNLYFGTEALPNILQLLTLTGVANVKVTGFSSSGTYTPDANLVMGIAIIKGGGGGGLTISVDPSLAYGGPAGGEGATSIKFFRPDQVTPNVAVGVASAVGTSTNGQTSSFGSLASAGGGFTGTFGFSGGPGGNSGSGDIFLRGAPGGQGIVITAASAATAGGMGGGSGGGIGGYTGGSPEIATGGNGVFGGGGGGAASRAAGPGFVGGGNGGAGVVWVIEFLKS